MTMPQNFPEWRRDNSGTLADYKAYRRQADAAEGITYRVIYRFGSTEVPSMSTHETYEEAWAEEQGADDEGLDETWIEEVQE